MTTITNYSQGFFVGPVTAEFGWQPAEFFLGFTLMMCLGVVTAPIVGALVAKFGIRKLGMFGLLGHALSYVFLSANPGSLALWYLSRAAVAVLGAASLPIIWTAVLNGWFRRGRGKAVGITMAGTGIGAFLLPPVVEYCISQYGWRAAYQVAGLGPFLLALPIVFFLLPIVAMFVLINMQLTMAAGLLVAVCIGLAAGAELDLLAYLTSKYFGPRHYPAIFGGIFAAFSVGAGIAPPLMGEAAMAWGGYDRPLLIFIALLVLSIVLFLSLSKYPEEGRREMASG